MLHLLLKANIHQVAHTVNPPGKRPTVKTRGATAQTRETLLAIDRNVERRAWIYLHAYNQHHKQRNQHQGPLTAACRDVMRALLWLTGRRSSISYEAIATEAKRSIDTVWRALKVLRAAGLITWRNRYAWSDKHRKVVKTTNHFSWLWPEMPNKTPKTENQNVTHSNQVPQGASQPIGAPHATQHHAHDQLGTAISRFLALKPLEHTD